MSKHTLGPWKIRRDGAGMYFVCNPDYSNWPIAEGILERDVNLIAAAPDLLEELEKLLECIEFYHLDNCYFDTDKTKQAIAKAKGEK